MLKNAFKKHPLQNRTNVQIEGGGSQKPFEQCSKKLHFFLKGGFPYFPEYFSDYFPDYFCLSQVLDQNLQFPTSRAIRHLADLVWSNDQKQRRKLRRGTVGRIIKERRHEIENRAELVLCGLWIRVSPVIFLAPPRGAGYLITPTTSLPIPNLEENLDIKVSLPCTKSLH